MFLGAADFDPGPGTLNLFSAGSFDAFLVRIAARPDLMGRNAAGRWWLASNDRTAFNMRQVGRWAESRRWHVLRADYNGDGRQDVLAQTGAGDWCLATPTASGFPAFRFWGRWNPAELSNVVTGDFGGDFRPDIAGMDGSGDWIVGLNTGHGFDYATWGMWDDAVDWPFVRAADFNGDDLTDLVGLDADGEWWVSQNTGDGAFTNEPWADWDPALGWRDLQVADFNNDGAADVAGRDRTGVWQVGLAQPDDHRFDLAPWVTWDATVTWRDVRVGDFTGDGLLDLIARHPATGEWQLSRNSGGTAFQAAEAWGRWPGVLVDVLVGDFDGDGRDDLVGRSTATGDWREFRSTDSAFLIEDWGEWAAGAWRKRAGGRRPGVTETGRATRDMRNSFMAGSERASVRHAAVDGTEARDAEEPEPCVRPASRLPG